MSWLHPADEDDRLLARLRADEASAEMLALARVVAPALRIERPLLRAARLAFLPGSTADVEVDLWFSELIESRSARALQLYPGVARRLTDECAHDRERFSDVLAQLREHSRHWHPLDRLEQDLRLALRDEDRQTVHKGLRQALRWLLDTQDANERRDVARWVRGVLPRLTEDPSRLDEFNWLAAYAAATLGDPGGLLSARTDSKWPAPVWLLEQLAELAPPTTVGLRWHAGSGNATGVLEVLPGGQGDQDLTLRSPLPAPVRLSCPQAGAAFDRWQPLQPGIRIPIPARCETLAVRTLFGDGVEATVVARETAEATDRGRARPGASFDTRPEPQGIVYLSFTHADEDKARDLAAALRREGLDVWSDRSIRAEQKFRDAVTERIERAACVVALVSDESLQSMYVEREWRQALGQQKLLPVAIESVDLGPLPDWLRDIQFVRLGRWQGSTDDTEFRALVDAISRFLPTEAVETKSEFVQETVEPFALYRTIAGVRLREGPGTDYDAFPLADILPDTQVAALRRSGDWVLVEVPSEMAAVREGWVHSRFLEPEPSSEATGARIRDLPRELIEALQRRLAGLGHDPGPPDGIWGRATAAAFAAFGEKSGLTTGDRLTRDLVRALWQVDFDPDTASSAEIKTFVETLSARSSPDRILWLDDHPENNASERRQIELTGVTFDLAQSLEEAIGLLSERRYAAVISHYDPGAMARDGLTDTLARPSGPPLIFYTSPRVVREHGARLRGQGAADVVSSPADLYRLVAQITGRPVDGEAEMPSQVRELLAEIEDPKTAPERRLEIGDELARLGDPRKGVGLDERGLPDIDWVEIPGGPFLYGEKRETRELPTFFIARYPITNVQYQAFVDAKGYADKRWWEGLAERIERPQEPRWAEPNRPRETVSWYEAMAFCRWLSDRLGYEVRLPSEDEWEKAARGTDGREYPWGEGYRAGYANIDEKTIKAGPTYLEQATAVGLYPHGASSYGVEDLAGNVLEWCLNEYDDLAKNDPGGKDPRALRGGSWYYDPAVARASVRSGLDPVDRLSDIGFRVMCSSPIDR